MHMLFPRVWKGRWEGSFPAAGSLEEELLGQAGSPSHSGGDLDSSPESNLKALGLLDWGQYLKTPEVEEKLWKLFSCLWQILLQKYLGQILWL